MAKLELYIQWDVYDENEEILRVGDLVRVSHNGNIIEGKITELYCMFDEEIAYIEIEPIEEASLEIAEFFDEARDIEEFERIEKIG